MLTAESRWRPPEVQHWQKERKGRTRTVMFASQCVISPRYWNRTLLSHGRLHQSPQRWPPTTHGQRTGAPRFPPFPSWILLLSDFCCSCLSKSNVTKQIASWHFSLLDLVKKVLILRWWILFWRILVVIQVKLWFMLMCVHCPWYVEKSVVVNECKNHVFVY